MVSGDGPKLARVSYLPGVTPVSQREKPSPESKPAEVAEVAEALEVAALPDFVSFFGAETDVESTDSPPSDVAGESGSVGRSSTRREVRAENVSTHALTRRGMSRWELEKTLLSRELDGEVVEAELDRLEGVGLLDDATLAETLVRTQHDRKGLGRGAITAELRRRHIDQEHIDAALEQVDDDDEQSRATELAVKRAGQLSTYDLETVKRRLHGFLSRRGYSSAVVRAAIDEALSSRSSGVRFR